MEIDNDAPLKVNAPVRAHTVEPLYVGATLVIPVNSSADGRVVKVEPVSKSQRIDACTHGDFTPLHQATLHFDRIIDPNGRVILLDAANAELATTTVRLQSKAVKQSLFGRLWSNATTRAKLFTRNFTAPGRATRAREFLYAQLPYHPQSLLPHTQYDIPLLALPTPDQPAAGSLPPPAAAALPKETFVLQSRLVTALNSKAAQQGDEVVAEVTQPFTDSAGHVSIPVGSLVRGSVLRASPARKLGRSGALRFTFTELVLPSGYREHVVGVPSAIYAEPGYPQRLDNEGGIQSQPKRSVLFPLVLGALATRSIRADENPRAHAAVSSNGFGLITRVVAISSGSNIAGGVIGGITTARAVYTRFIGRGQEVEFPAHTPIEIELNKTEAPVLEGHADSPTHGGR